MRIEFFARPDRHEIGHVVDQERLDIAAVLGAHECCCGPGFHREGRNRVDDLLLQPEQIFRRFDDNAGKPEWRNAGCSSI